MDELFVHQLEEANAYLDDNRSISEKKCVEMYGANGYQIYLNFEKYGSGKKFGYGDLQRTPKAKELRKSNFFKDLLKDIKQQEEDARLDREQKKSAIEHYKKTRIISWLALFISILSMTPIQEYLSEWIKRIISLIF